MAKKSKQCSWFPLWAAVIVLAAELAGGSSEARTRRVVSSNACQVGWSVFEWTADQEATLAARETRVLVEKMKQTTRETRKSSFREFLSAHYSHCQHTGISLDFLGFFCLHYFPPRTQPDPSSLLSTVAWSLWSPSSTQASDLCCLLCNV